MTRATWPLSRDAVEAAARAAYEHDIGESWDDAPEKWKEAHRWSACLVLRTAIARWVPRQGQCDVAGRMIADDMPTPDILLAAVRTEAAE